MYILLQYNIIYHLNQNKNLFILLFFNHNQNKTNDILIMRKYIIIRIIRYIIND